MSRVIPDRGRAGSGHVESPPGHHRRHRREAPVAEVAATYGVSRSWLYELLARYRDEGEHAFTARSRAPKTSPAASGPANIDLLLNLRKELTLDLTKDYQPHTPK